LRENAVIEEGAMSQQPKPNSEPRTVIQGIRVYVSRQAVGAQRLANTASWLRPLVPIGIASGVVTAAIVGCRVLGVLQGLELPAFDLLMRLRPDEGPDPRILVVAITDKDVARYNWPLTDRLLEQTLANLELHQPRAIGLDLFRDLPREPGHAALRKRLERSDTIIPICAVGVDGSAGVAPPPNVPEDFVGFADLVVDPDGVIRRNLMSFHPREGNCKTTNSLSLQLAVSYLAAEGIQPQYTAEQYPQLGPVTFRPLSATGGGYQQVDVNGYQILLNYRSPRNVARTVSLAEVLSNRVNPKWIQDRVVMIGSADPSLKDTFYTPYTAGEINRQPMPGVMIHANMVSQILSAVQDGRSLFWYWPDWAEAVWILGWALVGGALAWRVRHPMRLGLATLLAVGSLSGVCFVGFWAALWLPWIPTAIALVLTGASLVAYAAYQSQQEQKQFALRVSEQEQAIVQLQALLQQSQIATEASDGSPPPIRDYLNRVLRDRYRLRKILGAGGFAQTFLAEDTQRPGNPLCVVKHLRPASDNPQFVQVARRLFTAEAEILEALGKHDRIPQLLAYFEEDQEFFLVEEFIEGHSLADELPPHQPLSEVDVLSLLKDVMEILAFIHHYQVIHRDIKPSNVIRRHHDRRLVLIDFGAVKQMNPSLSAEPESRTVVVGTPGYAPPEQLSGHPVLSSDVYALGVVGIQALTGLQPKEFPRNTATGDFLWNVNIKVSRPFVDLLNRMVRYHFSDRYPSAVECLHDLERLPRSS
jgi:CHASE2 domain-containing sensor protein